MNHIKVFPHFSHKNMKPLPLILNTFQWPYQKKPDSDYQLDIYNNHQLVPVVILYGNIYHSLSINLHKINN